MEVYGIVWLSVDVHECMDVYGCLWMFTVACMFHGCLYACICIYVYIGYLASAPLRPRRGRSGEMADMYSYVWMCNVVYDYIWVCMVSMDMYGCV